MSIEYPAGHVFRVVTGWCDDGFHDDCPVTWDVTRWISKKQHDTVKGECRCDCHQTSANSRSARKNEND